MNVNELATLNQNDTVAYCSCSLETMEDKKRIYKATGSEAQRISDMVNMEISFCDVFVEPVECVNKETGLVTSAPRVVLIDRDGNGYVSVSVGIYNSVKKIFALFGTPDRWTEPITVKVGQITKGQNRILTLELV